MTCEDMRRILNSHRVWLKTNGDRGIRAELPYVNLSGFNFRRANLRWTDFTFANLRGADLRGAKLDGIDFYGADLRDAKFTPVIIETANLNKCKMSWSAAPWVTNHPDFKVIEFV